MVLVTYSTPRGQFAGGHNKFAVPAFPFQSLVSSLLFSSLWPRHRPLLSSVSVARQPPHLDVFSHPVSRGRKRGGNAQRRREIWKKRRTTAREQLKREREREREESGRLARNWNVLYTPITQKERCCSSSVIPGVYGSHRGCICNPTEREMTWVVGWEGEWRAGGPSSPRFAPVQPAVRQGEARRAERARKGEEERVDMFAYIRYTLVLCTWGRSWLLDDTKDGQNPPGGTLPYYARETSPVARTTMARPRNPPVRQRPTEARRGWDTG